MNKIITIVVIMLFCGAVRSETVKWMVRPQYDNIDYYSNDIFRCVKDNHITLLGWSGTPIVDQELLFDSVTSFNGGFALVLKKEDKGNRIMGFISEQKGHSFQRVTGDYYITQYPFFSEGYLVVSDANGKKGYLDESGQCVIDCKYDSARPFRKGFASVQINASKTESRGYYINPLGQTNNPLGFHDGKIDKGSSFNDDGEAVVKHERECAIIDRNMKVVRNRPYDRVFPIRTYDYAYSEDFSNPEPMANQRPDADNRFLVFENASGYGYRGVEGKVVVPAQFDNAFQICNGRAIVSMNGKYGILELVEGEFSSVCSPDDGKLLVFPEIDSSSVGYSVIIPDSFNQDKLYLRLDKGDGWTDEIGFTTEFIPVFEKGAKTCAFRAQLRSDDGLLLWEDQKSLAIANIRIGLDSPQTVTTFARENGIQQIKACVTNNSDCEVELTPSFVISFDRKSKNKIRSTTVQEPVIIKPSEKKELLVDVKVVQSENVTVKIIVFVDGVECGSNSSMVLLKTI